MKRGTGMNVEFYEYDELGYAVDPESDTKEITVILVGKQTVKANPRPAVIYVTGGAINESYEKLEELKKYCADNKSYFCAQRQRMWKNWQKHISMLLVILKKLNIVPEEISVKSDDDHTKQAEELVDYVLDEYDAEFGYSRKFSL